MGRSKGQSLKLSLAGTDDWALVAGVYLTRVVPSNFAPGLANLLSLFQFWRMTSLRVRPVFMNSVTAVARCYAALYLPNAESAVVEPADYLDIVGLKSDVAVWRSMSSDTSEAQSVYTCDYDWLHPKLGIGPYGGWFSTVVQGDSENLDSQGEITITGSTLTSVDTVMHMQWQMDVEFKDFCDDAVVPYTSVPLRSLPMSATHSLVREHFLGRKRTPIDAFHNSDQMIPVKLSGKDYNAYLKDKTVLPKRR